MDKSLDKAVNSYKNTNWNHYEIPTWDNYSRKIWEGDNSAYWEKYAKILLAVQRAEKKVASLKKALRKTSSSSKKEKIKAKLVKAKKALKKV